MNMRRLTPDNFGEIFKNCSFKMIFPFLHFTAEKKIQY